MSTSESKPSPKPKPISSPPKTTNDTNINELNNNNEEKKQETKEEKKEEPFELSTPLLTHSPSDKNILGSPIIEPREYNVFFPENYTLNNKLYSYDYKDLHLDLENQLYCGVYGWDNACYWGIAEKKAKTDLAKHYTKKHDDEIYLKEWVALLNDDATRKWWPRIVTFDPLGMTATMPTIAATSAILNISEISSDSTIKRDGIIIDEDGGIHVQKAAVYNVWNIPALAKRLELSESEFRETLNKYTGNPSLLDAKKRAFLPNIGGCTIYTFGDIRKIRDNKTEIAVRVHDECNGSDVFGTDICTCRPYLIFAIRACIECAQRGGVGIIAYFRKEGRSLGEITKYRVYNARKHQQGGDRAETYFKQTEKIAGIQDARFQTMMPDILNWLGIDRIDWLLSMSSEKYDAIIESGIVINQRVPLPDSYVPKHAKVEVLAKIAAGYHTSNMGQSDKNSTLQALRDLRTIRKQCRRIFKLAKTNELTYFTLNINKFDACVKQVLSCINEHYPDYNIPLHSRFRHFDQLKLTNLLSKWTSYGEFVNKKERVRRLIDLTTISVLLDAGAGEEWKYNDTANGEIYSRSEGLGIASFDMFISGLFSSDLAIRERVNSIGLLNNLTLEKFKIGFQISSKNKMVGLNGRFKLLKRLGNALQLQQNNEYFGSEIFRPGHLLDYLLRYCNEDCNGALNVSIRILWKAIIEGFETIWPKRMSGIRRGDVWIHNKLKKFGIPGSDMVPFHKLQQWLTYSLIEAFEYYGLNFIHLNDMTCLAEYRNGGLFVDTGVLTLKSNCDQLKYYDVGSELVVEWRAMTIILVDKIAERLRKILKKTEKELPLSKVLEGGTWRAGRELAYKLRKNGKSPINLRSDGTVF